MDTAFDHIAAKYDESFVHSTTGKLQREIVWQHLKKIIQDHPSLDMLDLGCGTGEDAIFAAGIGYHVIATDFSAEMIKYAQKKREGLSVPGDLEFKVLDMRKITDHFSSSQFDLIFSDFGAMNCLGPEDLTRLLEDISSLLKPGGKIVAVIMPRLCLWEIIYFTVKMKFTEVFRRTRETGLAVKLGNDEVSTWYYSPKNFRQLANIHFDTRKVMPVGICLPPSYLDPFFSRHPHWLAMLNRVERLLSACPFLASFSDHFLIELEVKS